MLYLGNVTGDDIGSNLGSNIGNVNSDDMGNQKKNENYHHGDLRAEILKLAISIVSEKGHDALSLRACARELGVDPAAVYRHYKNKDKVLVAVAAFGMDGLGGEMQNTLEEGRERQDSALAQLQSVGLAYCLYAAKEPNLYRLMFGGRCRSKEIEAIQENHTSSAFQLLTSALDRLTESGELSSESREGLEMIVWAQVHGLSALTIDGRSDIERLEGRVNTSLAALIRGLE